MMKDAVGVTSAYGRWWQATAERFELDSDYASAIDALYKARDLATHCAEDSGWSRYDFDLYQMKVLRELSATCLQQARYEEAGAALQRADEIKSRRKFPDRT
jgi:hypothetical protein